MTSIQQSLNQATKALGQNGINTASLDAEVLLSFVIKKSKEHLYTYPDEKLTATQTKKFAELIKRRSTGEPVAYLVGYKEFFGLNFKVNKTVLIPRPETEIMIEEVIKNKNVKTIIDIGTGSGCIAVTLAKHFPKAKIYAGDICKRALKVAQTNATTHKVKINFKPGNLLEPFKNIKADILIANLPYGWNAWKNNTNAETIGLKFEPKKALFTDEHGLRLYRELLEQIIKSKINPRFIYFEYDHRQTAELKELVKQYLPEYKIKIKKDLAGLDRVIILS